MLYRRLTTRAAKDVFAVEYVCAPEKLTGAIMFCRHLLRRNPFPCDPSYDEPIALMPRAPLGTPVRKPFLDLRATCWRVRMRPVPVVFLRLAFSPQP